MKATATTAVVQLIPAAPQHVSELGRICYEAFKDLEDRHHFLVDFPSAAVTRQVIGMLVKRHDFYGVAALLDGELVGSNFLSLMDPVAGVGPITVDCVAQGRDIGRALMQDVIDYARRNNIQRVRLMQEAHNRASLSLYASLGFDVKAAVMYMQAAAAATADSSVRPVMEADLPAIEQLSRQIYKTSRRNEVATADTYGFLPLLRERQGRITGYFLPGLLGHGVAETIEDVLILVGEAARRVPPEAARFFCPLTEGDLYRSLLKAGHRAIKVFTLMTLGPYEPPDEAWLPSVLY